MRKATPDQKAKEAAVLYTSLADLAIVIPMFIVGLTTSSLTLLSEAIRVALMLVVEFYSLLILRALHRDKLRKFRFGIGKIEQITNLSIGIALIGGGLWIGGHVIDTLVLGHKNSTPVGLAVAAVLASSNTLVNALGCYAMISAARSGDSAVFRAQLRARTIKLLASLVVQVTITIAALAQDPVISLWFDAIGGCFVACLQISIGLKMASECLRDLLDHPIPEAMKAKIDDLLHAADIAPREELARVRTRRSGSLPHVELTLAPLRCVSLDDFAERAGRVETLAQRDFLDADISIVIPIMDR